MSALRIRILALICITTLLYVQGRLSAQSAPPDLKYVADKPLLAVWAQPMQHLQNPAFAQLVAMIKKSPPEKGHLGEVLSKMDSLRLSVCLGKAPGSAKPVPQYATVVHFTEPEAAKTNFEGLSKGREAKQVEGVTYPLYIRMVAATPGELAQDWTQFPSAALLDSSTFVEASTAEMLFKVTKPTAGSATPVWHKELAALATTQSTVVIDLTQVRELLKEEKGPAGGMEALVFNNVKTLWEQADHAFISLDTTNGIQLSAMAQSVNAEAALRFKGTIEGLLGIGRGMLPLVKQETALFNRLHPGMGTFLYSEIEKLVNSIKITQDGKQTKLTLGIPQESLAKLLALLLPAIENARQAALANVSRNNLKQIALAMLSYQDANRAFPAAVMLGPDGKTPHSWRVAILPFLEEQTLFNQYKFDEPWDSENNKKVAAQIPQVYRSMTATDGPICTSYVVLTHADGVFNSTPSAKGARLARIVDGLSKTISVVEANTEIPWTKPEDLAIVDGLPLPKLGMPGSAVFHAAFCDGSVRTLTTAVKEEVLRNLVNMKDGKVVNSEDFEPPPQGPSGAMRNDVSAPQAVPVP
jgi:hypothetical protein